MSIPNTPKAHKASTIRQTIIETIEAPRLSDITTASFVLFKQKREIYERVITEKKADANVQIPLTTYRSSIPKPMLELFLLANWVSATKLEDITEDHLRACVTERSRVDPADYDLARIERELRDVKLERSGDNTGLRSQVWRLCLKYMTTLEKCGYDEFVQKQPKLAIHHILKRIAHGGLKKRILLTMQLRKAEFEKDFSLFIRELAREADVFDRHEVASRCTLYGAESEDDRSEEANNGFRKRNHKRGPQKNKDKRTVAPERADSGEPNNKTVDTKRKRDRDLPKSSREGELAALVAEMTRTATPRCSPLHSVMVPWRLQFSQTQDHMSLQLGTPYPHGEKLILRNTKWLVSDNELGNAYIGRHLLSALGIDNRVLLAAARDRLGGIVNVPELLKKAGYSDDPCATRNGSIQSILRERGLDWGSTYHSHGGAEYDTLDESGVYVDLGEDTPEELDEALMKIIADATENGLSEAGVSRLRNLLHKFRKVFRIRLGSLDFVSGYWQLPLDPESWGKCGVVTPLGVAASTRVLPGLANAVSHFQSNVEPCFAELRDNMKAWLDDFSLHATEETTLLDKLERFLEICDTKNLFLSARKSVLFATVLRWCGRVITAEGYTMYPARLSGLKDMAQPKMADELAEFIYCVRWMSIAIPEFSKRVAPLVTVLEEAYEKVGKRTKRAIKNIALRSLSWGPDEERAFANLQDSLRNAVKMSYCAQDKVPCVFTDASNRFWSGVITQTTTKDLLKPFEEQRHEPLAFLGSEFKGAQLHWTTFEKEAFAIYQTFERMDYLLLGQKRTHIFTDHRNLLFIFAPLALEPALGRHVVSKVQRWALYLTRFYYAIEHISGSDNVFADLLTRWGRGYRNENQHLRVQSVILQTAERIIPSSSDLVWPDLDVFRSAQRRAAEHRPSKLVCDSEDKLWKHGARIWVPNGNAELQLKVLVI
eukprot:IDg2686t1